RPPPRSRIRATPPLRRQLRHGPHRTIAHPLRRPAEPAVVLRVGRAAHRGGRQGLHAVQEGRNEAAAGEVLPLAGRQPAECTHRSWTVTCCPSCATSSRYRQCPGCREPCSTPITRLR